MGAPVPTLTDTDSLSACEAVPSNVSVTSNVPVLQGRVLVQATVNEATLNHAAIHNHVAEPPVERDQALSRYLAMRDCNRLCG